MHTCLQRELTKQSCVWTAGGRQCIQKELLMVRFKECCCFSLTQRGYSSRRPNWQPLVLSKTSKVFLIEWPVVVQPPKLMQNLANYQFQVMSKIALCLLNFTHRLPLWTLLLENHWSPDAHCRDTGSLYSSVFAQYFHIHLVISLF